MADMLATGAAWLSKQLGSYAAHAITYARKAVSISVQASVGRTAFRIDQDGAWIRIETRDFLFDPDSIAALQLPEPGDLITETISGTSTSYEVMAPGGEPCWRWSGPTRDRIRVHSTRVSASA